MTRILFKIIIALICFIPLVYAYSPPPVYLIGSTSNQTSGTTNNYYNVTNNYVNGSGIYYFEETDYVTQNTTLSLGVLTINVCSFNYTGGRMVSSDCGTPTTNYAGITQNYYIVNSTEFSLGVLTVKVCQQNYTTGLLNSSTC